MTMEFLEYGRTAGRLVVYFHGVPGGPEECSVFDDHARAHNLRVVCYERLALPGCSDRSLYYQSLADEIDTLAAGQPLDLIGFSLGAHAALEVAMLLETRIRSIHLISAAAPLEQRFLDDMAGAAVFRLASQRPLLFRMLTHGQRLIAILAPGLLFAMLFSSATGQDRELSQRSDFRDYLIPVLKRCLVANVDGYIRDITYYVAWRGELASCENSVTLWHGSEDNWSPLAMASSLSDAVAGSSAIEEIAGASHYSCLFQVAPMICEQLQGL
jgi:pimeloyl-ACP methyl ester carboxylesterase